MPYIEWLINIKFDDLSLFISFPITTMCLYYITKKSLEYAFPYRNLTDIASSCAGMRLKVRMIHVNDGDGFEFEHIAELNGMSRGSRLKARLAGIDAPEGKGPASSKQELSDESKLHLIYFISRRVITLEVLGLDCYNRLLVVVHACGVNVNSELLITGLAVIYREGNAKYGMYKSLFERNEQIAYRCKFGLWGLKNYESPAEYKKRKNLHRESI